MKPQYSQVMEQRLYSLRQLAVNPVERGRALFRELMEQEAMEKANG